MANTYSQIYIQTVFAVESRLSLIRPEFKEDLYKYMTGIVKNQGQKLISINGVSDHVHILIYGHSQLDTIIRYIQNQEKHHQRRSFKDEYLAWLKKYEIPFEEKYVFKFIE